MKFSQISPYIIAIISLIFAYVIYKKSRKEKIPCWTYRNTIIVGKSNGDSEEIRIYFKDNEVKKVVSTKIYIWNKGKAIIKKEDNPDTDPLRLILPKDLKVLRTKVIKKSRSAIIAEATSELKNEDNIIKYKFNFLDYFDGFVIEILHTGSEDLEIEHLGTIFEVKKGFKKFPTFEEFRSKYKYIYFSSFAILWLFDGFLIYLIKILFRLSGPTLIWVATAIIGIGGGFYFYMLELYEKSKSVPKFLQV